MPIDQIPRQDSGQEEQIVLANGLRLAARVWGPAEGIPTLAMHGWTDNAASFDRLAPLLEGPRLVSLDLPGHGRSQHRGIGAEYEFVQWLPDVLAAANALTWDRFFLLGHSLGGAIALSLAALAPKRVMGVATIDALGPLTLECGEAIDRLGRAIHQRQSGTHRPPLVYPTLQAMKTKLRDAVPGLDDRAATILVSRGHREVAGGFTWSHDQRLRSLSLQRLTEGHVRDLFAKVQCPVLMVRARQGWPVPEDVVQRRLSWLSTTRVEEVDGDHHVHLTAPERVAPLVQGFLQEHSD